MNEMPDFTLEIPNNGLPDPAEVTYYVLEKERKLYLDYDVDDNSLNIQKMILRWNMEDRGKPVEERKPIWLYILSPGGAIAHMWAICDAINLSKTPVYTVNVGVAASAATAEKAAVPGGPSQAGQIVLICCIVVLFIIGFVNLKKQNEKQATTAPAGEVA